MGMATPSGPVGRGRGLCRRGLGPRLASSRGADARLVVSCGSILFASWLASRIGVPSATVGRRSPSGRWAAVRTIIPMSYVGLAASLGSVASPRWAGLVSTFPSMSTVVLAVTHLEEGPASASRIARTLPPANLSTAAFLAAFRFGCPLLGLAGGALCGFGAALITLAAMELVTRWLRLPSPPESRRSAQPAGGGHPRDAHLATFPAHFPPHASGPTRRIRISGGNPALLSANPAARSGKSASRSRTAERIRRSPVCVLRSLTISWRLRLHPCLPPGVAHRRREQSWEPILTGRSGTC